MEINEMIEKYGITNAEIFLPENSFANKVRLVTTKNNEIFVFKYSSNKKKFAHEISALNYYSQFINIPKVISATSFSENENLIVMTYIKGITYDEYSQMNLINKLAFDYGKILGKLHSIPKLDEFGDENNWKEYCLNLIKKTCDVLEKKGGIEKFKNAIHYLKKSVNLLDKQDCVCLHFDYRPGNVMIDNGQVVGLIDFESSPNGDSVYDFVKFFNCLNTNAKSDFLEGYKSVRRIPENFEEKLEFYTKLNSFGCLSFLINENRFDDNFYKENEGILLG